MPVVDLLFPVRGGPVPLDHGYLLFSALSARLDGLHERRDIGVFNLRGSQTAQGQLELETGSLRLRCSTEALPLLLPLSGITLELAGVRVRLGNPGVRALTKPTSLSARVVTFKHSLDEQSFHGAAVKFLAEMGCSGRPYVGRRRVVRIAGKKVVGFALDVSGLSPESSLLLQEQGLGGRRHMGCGLFLPTRLRGPASSEKKASDWREP
ncbi:type I-MYXAN CRISPR-associated protein Cas6/Cmx6 [Cystobacter ferrugineus]|uniref:Type I-MYXAN CRISPR-associated protein Cas6/Cmx6 n=1 Tax=Cystobacter ferrugineus TaxID=83449 RepID=A0A1L9AV97_9BACT|nr:type I-MYXAN CRISPR-associated protein Cas6/Cmx6 [Cystobacter ferrugineus]OJH33914.1 type I-MYXAN CRISPR-associated protein Cas6/Cmx6 [Cystobacter ferrugineus]